MKLLLLLSTLSTAVLLVVVFITCVVDAHLHHHHLGQHEDSDHQHDHYERILKDGILPDELLHADHHHSSTCIHDSVIIPHMEKNPPVMHAAGTQYHPEAQRGEAHALSVGNLRIVFRTEDLTTAGRFCATASGSVPDFLGGTIACSTNTIFNSTKLATLRDKILPAAAQVLSNAIQVNQVTGNLQASSTSVCSVHTIPSTDVSSGISNADLVLYVSAAPIASSTTIAWAGACETDTNGRPTIGKINFSPAHLIGFFDNDEKFRLQSVNTAVHEILHAMGFSYSMFTKNFTTSGTSSIVSTTTRRGKTVYQLTSTNALAAARTQLGCTTLTGVELEDAELATITAGGTALSHFERRVYFGEMMTGISDRNNVLSAITLGVLQDSGHYFPVASAAQALRWGNNAGCTFSEDKCGLATGGMGTYFCETASDKTCTFDNRSFGLCTYQVGSTAISPAWFQHFTDNRAGGPGGDLMDFCPYVAGYTNYQCDETSRQPTAIETELGFVFGSSSRCFVAPDFKQSGSTATAPGWRGRCMSMACNSGGFIQITLSDNSVVNCPTSGAAGDVTAPTGWTGTITCPSYTDMCTGIATVLSTTSTSGPSTTSTTTTTTTMTTTTASPPITTLGASVEPGYVMRIKGGFSLRTLFTTRQSALVAALQADVANTLGLVTGFVTITIDIDNASAAVIDTTVIVSIFATPQNMFAVLADETMIASVGMTSPAWLTQTNALHLQVGSNQVTVESITATTSTTGLTRDSNCSHGCRLFIVACLFGGSFLLLVLAWIGYELYLVFRGPVDDVRKDGGGEDDDDDEQGTYNTTDEEDNEQQQYDDEGYPIKKNSNNNNTKKSSSAPPTNSQLDESTRKTVEGSGELSQLSEEEQKKRMAINRLLHSDPVDDHLDKNEVAKVSNNDPAQNHSTTNTNALQTQQPSSGSNNNNNTNSNDFSPPKVMSAPPREELSPIHPQSNSNNNEPFAESNRVNNANASINNSKKKYAEPPQSLPPSPTRLSASASQPNFDGKKLGDQRLHESSSHYDKNSSKPVTQVGPSPAAAAATAVAPPASSSSSSFNNNNNNNISSSNVERKSAVKPPTKIPERRPSGSGPSALPSGPPKKMMMK